MSSTTQIRTLTDVIDTEYKEYSMYVVENRAIPAYTDGFKNVHRKIVYAALNHFKNKKVKVAELGSSISSLAAYHHGETSAMGAAITLAADWNNNMPVLQGSGNFGSRLIQEAAAPRYIFAELSKDFYKYFTDFSVCTKHSDPENPEPQQYLPIIPWVLVNGIEGIAVGFACRYLPHSPKDIAKACIKAVNGKLKDDATIPVTLPGFKGEIIQETQIKIVTRGIVDRVKRNTWLISEVPWGFDREKFFLHLDKMVEQGKIQDFEDQCDDSGFKFTVKMDGKMDETCAKDPISYFKLERSFSENYTALDEEGKLIQFNTKAEIVNRFVDFRIKKVQERLEFDSKKLQDEINWLDAKANFINDIVNKKVNLVNHKKAELITLCTERYNVLQEVANRLVSIPVYDMTSDSYEDLINKIKEKKAEKENLDNSDPREVYLSMLKSI